MRIVEVVAGLEAGSSIVGLGDEPAGASQGGGGERSRFVCPVVDQVRIPVVSERWILLPRAS
jgi:hypothetical protein